MVDPSARCTGKTATGNFRSLNCLIFFGFSSREPSTILQLPGRQRHGQGGGGLALVCDLPNPPPTPSSDKSLFRDLRGFSRDHTLPTIGHRTPKRKGSPPLTHPRTHPTSN